MKYHIPPGGVPGKCEAEEGQCPYEVFDTKEEAQKAYEDLREPDLFPPLQKLGTNDIDDAFIEVDDEDDPDDPFVVGGLTFEEATIFMDMEDVEEQIKDHRYRYSKGSSVKELYDGYGTVGRAKGYTLDSKVRQAFYKRDYDEVRRCYIEGLAKRRRDINPTTVRHSDEQLYNEYIETLKGN